MSTNSHVSRRMTALLAIIFLLPSLILFMMWSSLSLRFGEMAPEMKMETYLGYFPKGTSIGVIHVISLICCVLAIVFAARSFKKHLLWVRVMMLMVVVVAIFIILFDIYQMV